MTLDTGPCFVRITRAFGAPSVYFGPFDSYDKALAWCEEKLTVAASIIFLNSPDSDTGPFSEVWR